MTLFGNSPLVVYYEVFLQTSFMKSNSEEIQKQWLTYNSSCPGENFKTYKNLFDESFQVYREASANKKDFISISIFFHVSENIEKHER